MSTISKIASLPKIIQFDPMYKRFLLVFIGFLFILGGCSKHVKNRANDTEVLITKLMLIAKENPEGFTVYTATLEPVKKGWVVALKETQNSFGIDGLKKVLGYAKKTGTIGGWKEEDLFYWDAVIIVQDEEEATKLGIENEQIAIFNIEQVRVKYLNKSS